MRGLMAKVAVITGAASHRGIGFAIARRFAEEGARLMLTDIDPAVETRANELRATGADAAFAIHDVTSEAAWDQVVADTLTRFGTFDILVNNAGIAILGDVADLAPSAWQKQMDVNMTSIFLGCRCAARTMPKRRNGSIINMASVGGMRGNAGASAYSTSKAAVRMFTKSFAMEVAKDGIRVNCVHPGLISTEMNHAFESDTPEIRAIIEARVPMARLGLPDEIAPMVAFLASDEARYCTGGDYVVDGGMIAH